MASYREIRQMALDTKSTSEVRDAVKDVVRRARARRLTLQNQSYVDKTDEELRFIIKDAGEAARNMRDVDPKAEAKYLD